MINRRQEPNPVVDSPVARSSSSAAIAAGLELVLFGPLVVRVRSKPLPHLRSRKGLWLLALLALRRGRDVDREWLAGTLWPDCDLRHGLHNLRQSLCDLRQALGPEAWRLSSDEPRSLRLDVRDVTVDALEFDSALERGDPGSLAAAVRLYRGPLLEDCTEEWAVDARRQREQAHIEALERLAGDAILTREYGVAAGYYRAAARMEPFREDLQRSLMQALADEGSPAAALLVYREYRALLAREMAAEPADDTTLLFKRLRDLTRGGQNSAAAPDGKMARSKEPKSSPSRRTLPTPLTALIGREKDVQEVVNLLSRSRLVTLTGTGGVGKTRLAIEAADRLESTYPDGAVFVDLAPLRDPALVTDAVRMAVGAPLDPAQQNPVELLSDYLSGRQLLLVMDNCEHLAQACGSLAETLLLRCADLTILATGRQALGLKGEAVWRVPSLPVPRTASGPVRASDIQPVTVFTDYAAIRLFAERAKAAERCFEINTRNSIALAKVCSRLDGIPLAIELAAAHVKAMSVEKIAERLNDRFRILLGRRRASSDLPLPRHQTLRASIDWSYNLLTEREQALLNRLSIFVGGWTLESAEAICSGEPLQEWEMLELITVLVEKSLVVYQPEVDRYRLLESIRQYAWDHLVESGEHRTARTRHLDHFLAMVEEIRPKLIGPEQERWFAVLEEEHDNLRAALSFCLEQSQVSDVRCESGESCESGCSGSSCQMDYGLRLGAALELFWRTRGHLREGRQWLKSLLSIPGEPRRTVVRADALNGQGTIAFLQGDFAGAQALFEESFTIRQELTDKKGMAGCLNNLALVAAELDDYTRARDFYEQALRLNRETGNRHWEATNLTNLGLIAYDQADYDAARLLHDQSLRLFSELGDKRGVADTLYYLGLVAKDQADYLAARCRLKASLAMSQELMDHRGIAYCLEAFASIESVRPTGNARAAALLLGAADRLRDGIGSPLSPKEEAQQGLDSARLRESLGHEEFASARAEGRTIPLDRAIDQALEMSGAD